MVFIHYADEHPLYTYAFYSPRTKRVIYRQDCIFLPTVFPMRKARQAAGMIPNGEQILPFRSPLCMREDSDPAYSFENWNHPDPLPAYEDHVLGVKLTRPSSDGTSLAHPAPVEGNLDPYFPSTPHSVPNLWCRCDPQRGSVEERRVSMFYRTHLPVTRPASPRQRDQHQRRMHLEYWWGPPAIARAQWILGFFQCLHHITGFSNSEVLLVLLSLVP